MSDSIELYTKRTLVQHLLDEPAFAEFAHVVLGAIVLAVAWRDAPHQLLVGWQGAVWVTSIGRFFVRRHFAASGVERSSVPWQLRLMVGLVGLSWGVGGFVAASFLPRIDFALLLVVMCGLCAGGTLALLGDPGTYYGFLIGMLTPLVVGLLRTEHVPTSQGALAVVVLFGIAMALLFRRLHGILRGYIRNTRLMQSTTAEIARERSFLDGLVRQAPAGVVVLDEDGRVARVNAAFERLFGYSELEVRGERLADLIVPGNDESAFERTSARVMSGETVEEERPRRRKDGTPIDVRVSASPLAEAGGMLLLYADVTEARERARLEAARNAVVALIADAASEEEIIDGVLGAVGETLQWDVATIWHVDADRRTLRNQGLWHTPDFDPGEFGALCRSTTYDFGYGLAGRVWAEERALWIAEIDDARELPRAGAAVAAGLHTAVALPLRVGGAIVGVIEFFCRSPSSEDRAMIDTLAVIALQVGNAVERRRAEIALRQARDAAEQATAAKSAFLAHMSHEIRTPLNGILGMAELLLDSPLAPDDQRAAQLIATSGDALLAIINDVLDFSKIEAEELTLDESEFDLRALIESTADLLASRAADARTDVFIDIDASVPRWVGGDATRLRQVLTNLIGNAVKFTPNGSVIVRAERALDRGIERETGAFITFRVRDTGIGIAPHQLDSIFEAFRQADVSTTRRFGGTGLGLAISRQLVRLMGGDLRVESTVGVGSTFSFTVPFRVAAHGSARRDGTRSGSSEIGVTDRPRAVLVVEDNPVNQEVATRMLRKRGHQVDVAPNGREALRLLESHSYEIVLMDVQMPELDGVEATRLLRERMRERTPTIIAVTANATSAERERCLSAGMDGYLAKPVRPASLFAAVEQPAATSLVRRATPVENRGPVVDLDRLRADLAQAGVPDILGELLETFTEDAERRLAAIDDAARGGSHVELERAAHAFKSAAAAIYARELADRLAALERAAREGDSPAWESLVASVHDVSARTVAQIGAESAR